MARAAWYVARGQQRKRVLRSVALCSHLLLPPFSGAFCCYFCMLLARRRIEELEKEKRAVAKTIDDDAAAKKKEADDGKGNFGSWSRLFEPFSSWCVSLASCLFVSLPCLCRLLFSLFSLAFDIRLSVHPPVGLCVPFPTFRLQFFRRRRRSSTRSLRRSSSGSTPRLKPSTRRRRNEPNCNCNCDCCVTVSPRRE